MAVWSHVQTHVATDLAYKGNNKVYRLYSRSVCDTTAPLQLQLPLVALYKCYTFTFKATTSGRGANGRSLGLTRPAYAHMVY